MLRRLIKQLFWKENASITVAMPITKPATVPPPLARCPWCHYWNDDAYNNSFLKCAVHPLGIDTPVCPDFKNKVQVGDFHYWEAVGLWGLEATREGVGIVGRTFAVLPSRALDLIWQWQEDNPKQGLGDLVELVRDERLCLRNNRLQVKE